MLLGLRYITIVKLFLIYNFVRVEFRVKIGDTFMLWLAHIPRPVPQLSSSRPNPHIGTRFKTSIGSLGNEVF